MTHTIKTRGLIIHEDKVFLCRPTARPYFTLPWGTIESTDNSLEAWCAREILEEIGIEAIIGPAVFVREFVNKTGNKILEIWFRVMNAEAFLDIGEKNASHGYEIAEADFYDLQTLGAHTRPQDLLSIVKQLQK